MSLSQNVTNWNCSLPMENIIKKLKTENLRDHMSDAELVFTALAELSTPNARFECITIENIVSHLAG